MAIVKFVKTGIQAISATVPKNTRKTLNQTDYFSEEHLARFAETTGVLERRIADETMCASDLCYAAAENLFDKTGISKASIDVLIFVSQTPDYKVPGNSILLQDRLGLPKTIMAFDANITCSGFLYGLFLSFSLVNTDGIDNVLLLVGETLSKMISPYDKSTGLLMGDAGSAILINKKDYYEDSHFSLNTDGSNYKSVLIPAGGYRNMSSQSTLETKICEDGSKRNEEQLQMEGLDVFSFAVTELPKDIKRLLAHTGTDVSEIDKFIFHQANKYMNDFIVKKAKLDKSKVLFSIQKYGNTSGVSIPLTMVDQREQIADNDLVLFNAIGAGFSWGSALMRITNCSILELTELQTFI